MHTELGIPHTFLGMLSDTHMLQGHTTPQDLTNHNISLF